ncbi:MAG: hypothetical protein LBI43_02920, partial [Streptococcaceae bacterium]|nr:hypothetical protein [Streptococcaceae bacterium]
AHDWEATVASSSLAAEASKEESRSSDSFILRLQKNSAAGASKEESHSSDSFILRLQKNNAAGAKNGKRRLALFIFPSAGEGSADK